MNLISHKESCFECGYFFPRGFVYILSADVDGTGKREGKKGGKPSKPSKFVPGTIRHSGFVSDDQVRFSTKKIKI
jgi:hypothetical protein